MPFGSALERRSRTTYRPTVTPEESTHVDTFTGTTSSFSCTASAKVAAAAVVRQSVFAWALWPDDKQSEHYAELLGASSRRGALGALSFLMNIEHDAPPTPPPPNLMYWCYRFS